MNVDYRTGEITEPGTTLATIDRSAASVVTLLEQAKSWLATCVEMTGPAEIAAAKAQIVTAETYARELRLSKDIQMDAQEMVRRAEYALGKSIRKGQADGVIGVRHVKHADIGGADIKTPHEAAGLSRPQDLTDAYSLADGVEEAEFDAALSDAKAEGNLSRANVVRKIKGQSSAVTRDMRADMIRSLADQGYSSRQMPAKVGVTEETVRQIARDFGIEIQADKAVSRARRHDSHRIASETVATLDGLAMGIELINYDDLDPEEARQWADSLNHSLRALNRFHKQIKETTHD
jgi:hypothetical protein